MSTFHLRDLLLSKMEAKGINRKEIVRYYGHANTAKAYRNLDGILDEGPLHETILRGELVSKIAELLEITFEEIEQAVSDDRAEAEAEALAHAKSIFRPMIFVEAEHRPNGICIFGIAGGMKRWRTIILPPDIASYPEANQLEVVRTEIEKHYSKQEGIVPMCGKITGYSYCPTFESSYEFNIEGERVSGIQSRYMLPTISVSLA